MADNKSNKDKNLDDLLNSCLKDFDSNEQPDPAAGGDQNSTVSKENTAPELYNDEFFAEQAKLLSERMNGIFNSAQMPVPSAEQMNLGFQKLAEAAAVALQGDLSAADPDTTKYADSISEALKGLKDGSENLQAPVNETDVANMFANLGLGDGQSDNEGGNPFLPFMQGMMQSLLSAEILLPSIVELLDKYPKYLEDNADTLSVEDKDRYEKQLELFQDLKNDLEAETPDDTTEVKQERFKKILDNMQKLHDYGQPPEELLSDIGAGALPGLDFNLGQAPGVQGENQCPMM